MEESEECHQLRNTRSGESISSYVSSSYFSGVHSDLDIICNNTTFKCHKVELARFFLLFTELCQVILSMQCLQLRNLITEDHDVLMIPDIHQEKVGKLLTFLYQGVLDINRTEVGDFLGLIEQWGISPEVTFLPKPRGSTFAVRRKGEMVNIKSDIILVFFSGEKTSEIVEKHRNDKNGLCFHNCHNSLCFLCHVQTHFMHRETVPLKKK